MLVSNTDFFRRSQDTQHDGTEHMSSGMLDAKPVEIDCALTPIAGSEANHMFQEKTLRN